MSEPIPESIPTSQDPRSKRPTKRLALTPTTAQAASLTALFAKPDREIQLPPSSGSAASSKRNALPPPPEIVANVQGSSAGAGSGEFHVYKASRRREYERVKMMEEDVEREEKDRDFERRREEMRKKDEERTEKRRKKREKNRARGKKGKDKGEKVDHGESEGGEGEMDVGENVGAAHVAESGKEVEQVGVVIHDDDDG